MDTEFVRRFQQEARAAAALNHPNIVTIYDVGQGPTTGHYFIAMEYVDGESLKEYLHQRGPLPAEEALRILAPIASALDHAHRKGFVHRDIKPTNIIVERESGRPVLTDFGVVKALREGTSITHTGSFIGTVRYASPEQIQGKEMDHHSDLYSFGVVAYEVLTGNIPFPGDTMAVLFAHVHSSPPPVHERVPTLPAQVDPILERMLAKVPKDRYETASSFVSDLRDVLTGEAIAKREKELPRRRLDVTAAGRDSRRFSWVVGGTLAAVMTALLFIGWARVSGFNWPWSPTPLTSPGNEFSVLRGTDGVERATDTPLIVVVYATGKRPVEASLPTTTVDQAGHGTATPFPMPTPSAVGTTSPTVVSSPTPLLEGEWILYEKPSEGFAIALPPAWRQLDVNSTTVETFLEIVKEQNPEVRAIWSEQVHIPITSAIRFIGLDLSPESVGPGSLTGVAVLKQPVESGISVDMFVETTRKQLETMSSVAQPVQEHRVNLMGGEGRELQYRIRLAKSPDQVLELFVVQYTLLVDSNAYVVVLSTMADQAEKYRPIFERIGQGFRLEPAPQSGTLKGAGVSLTPTWRLTRRPTLTYTPTSTSTPAPALVQPTATQALARP